MIRHFGSVLALLVVAGLLAAPTFAQKPKIKDTVTFAKSWDAAVEEARLLNVPIVLHDHGFY